MKMAKGLGWALLVFGLWEVLAPLALGYSTSAVAAQDWVIGAAWATFGLWIALTNKGEAIKWLGWISAIIGLWLVFAPGILGYTSIAAAFWNDLLVGFAGAVLGMWAAFNAPKDEPAEPQPIHH